MGYVAAAAAIFSAGKSIVDQNSAKREARAYRAQLGEEQARVAKQQAKADRALSQNREKAARGLARANRSSSSGSLFGDSTVNSTQTSSFLGG